MSSCPKILFCSALIFFLIVFVVNIVLSPKRSLPSYILQSEQAGILDTVKKEVKSAINFLSGFLEKNNKLSLLIQGNNLEQSGTKKRIAVILVREQNKNELFAKQYIQDLVFGDANSITTYINDVSYGKMSLVGDVFGWYVLPTQSSCDSLKLISDGINAADQEVNFLNYDFVFFIYTAIPCGVFAASGNPSYIIQTQEGTVSVGFAQFNGTFSFKEAVHELGHLLDLGHADGYFCYFGYVISDVPGSCFQSPNTDIYDMMGHATNTGHYNGLHKAHLGWLIPEKDIQLAKTEGVYTLEALEAPLKGKKAIVIPRYSNSNGGSLGQFWLEYRISHTLFPPNSAFPPTDDGILVYITHGYPDVNSFDFVETAILNMKPGVYNDTLPKYTLSIGKTFTDFETGVSFTPIAREGTNIMIKISNLPPPLKVVNPPGANYLFRMGDKVVFSWIRVKEYLPDNISQLVRLVSFKNRGYIPFPDVLNTQTYYEWFVPLDFATKYGQYFGADYRLSVILIGKNGQMIARDETPYTFRLPVPPSINTLQVSVPQTSASPISQPSLSSPLSLSKGDNFISSTLIENTPTLLSSLKTTCKNLKASKYDNQKKLYTEAKTLTDKESQGYRIATDNDCSITLKGDRQRTPADFNGMQLRAGLNLIGAPSQPTQFNQIKGGCVITSGPLLTQAGKTTASQTLDPGRGYLVIVQKDCTLGAPKASAGPPNTSTQTGSISFPGQFLRYFYEALSRR